MRQQDFAAATGVVAMAAVALLAAAPAGQEQATDAAAFEPPRTPWGDPDLQGIWSPGYILTPLERPDEFAGQEFLTDEDVAALEERASVRRRDVRAEPGLGRGRRGRVQRGVHRPRQGGDPDAPHLAHHRPAGRADSVHRARPGGGRRRAREDAERAGRRAGGPARPGSLPRRQPAVHQRTSGTFSRVVQTPGSVTLYHEDGHIGGAYRTVSLDGRPHVPAHVRQWLGDSVGRWEGDTLVVRHDELHRPGQLQRLRRAVAPGGAVHPRRGRPDHVPGHGRRPAGLDRTLDHRAAAAADRQRGETRSSRPPATRGTTR